MDSSRVRRSPAEARQVILEAASQLLAERGVAGVQLRAVGARVGMTDAGITHHFGNRETLLAELLRFGGRELRSGLDRVVAEWLAQGPDISALVSSLEGFYDRGYAELAVGLHAAGWRDRGAGMLSPVVEALHALRPKGSSRDETRHAVAALHQAMALQALYGTDFRRSAGLIGTNATDVGEHLKWWTSHLERSLGIVARPSRETGVDVET